MSFPNPATQFPPGRSGNPGGRPKGRSLTAILREALDADTLGEMPIVGGKTVADVLVQAMLGHAISGDAALIREAFTRIDGKVPDPDPPREAKVVDVMARAKAIRAARKVPKTDGQR